MPPLRLLFAFLAVLSIGTSAYASTFSFEQIITLDEMTGWVSKNVPLGTDRAAVHRIFIREGHATFYRHPTNKHVEKYVYDINLCSYYVWRWNISADFTDRGKLTQIFVNGNAVHNRGTQPAPSDQLKDSRISQVTWPRPEAHLGESTLSFLVRHQDKDIETTANQWIIGGGPSRADPTNLGTMKVYTDVEHWRSIFDFVPAPADRIVPFSGDCNATR